VTKDFISTNLSAEFYIRVEPAEDDVKKPAERIGEIKVLQMGGMSAQGGAGSGSPLLGNALGPMMKTILETSAMMPMLKDVMKFAGAGELGDVVAKAMGAPERTKNAVVPAAVVSGSQRSLTK